VTTVAEAGIRRAARTRADALRNRERIVAAARETLVEYGPEAPFDEIARRAGIGNATLYRHFADRRALIHDILLSVVTRTAEQAEAAAGEPDPFAALRRFAHTAVDEKAGALCGLLVHSSERNSDDLRAQCARLEKALGALMEKARRTGQLRTDVTTGDLMLALAQLSRPLPGAGCPVSEAHRHLRLFLDGLRAPAPSGDEYAVYADFPHPALAGPVTADPAGAKPSDHDAGPGAGRTGPHAGHVRRRARRHERGPDRPAASRTSPGQDTPGAQDT
jgi:AcrR family transcriptional regulator